MDILLKTYNEKSSIILTKKELEDRYASRKVYAKENLPIKNRRDISQDVQRCHDLMLILDDQISRSLSVEECGEEWFEYFFYANKNFEKNLKKFDFTQQINSCNLSIAMKLYSQALHIPWSFTSSKSQKNYDKLLKLRKYIIFSKAFLDEKINRALKQTDYVLLLYQNLIEHSDEWGISNLNHIKTVAELTLNKLSKSTTILNDNQIPEISSTLELIEQKVNLLMEIVKTVNEKLEKLL